MSETVSIVLTVYNMESCLRETMDSVIAQSYRNLEIICIDDGSRDASLSILEEYAAADERVRVYTQENAGPALSRNRGLDLATGSFVMLLDSDDIYDSTMVEKLLGRALETQADVVVCRSAEYDHASGKITSTPWTAKVEQIPAHDPFNCNDMADYILTAFIGWPWDKLYRRAFIEENSLRFPAMANSEDLYFVFLSLIEARLISFYDEVLIRHRTNRSGSVSNSRTAHPTEFYHGICTLKAKLQENPTRYERLAWGYLNWAFDYTLWNIESLPQGEVRTQLIRQLAEGGFPELELDVHGANYFRHTEQCVERYELLMEELAGAKPVDPRNNDAHPWAGYIVAFFAEVQRRGWKSAVGDVVNFIRHRSANEPDDEQRRARDRGELLRWRQALSVAGQSAQPEATAPSTSAPASQAQPAQPEATASASPAPAPLVSAQPASAQPVPTKGETQ